MLVPLFSLPSECELHFGFIAGYWEKGIVYTESLRLIRKPFSSIFISAVQTCAQREICVPVFLHLSEWFGENPFDWIARHRTKAKTIKFQRKKRIGRHTKTLTYTTPTEKNTPHSITTTNCSSFELDEREKKTPASSSFSSIYELTTDVQLLHRNGNCNTNKRMGEKKKLSKFSNKKHQPFYEFEEKFLSENGCKNKFTCRKRRTKKEREREEATKRDPSSFVCTVHVL